MTFKQDVQFYVARWKEVEAVQAEERRTDSLELRWRQLNAACALAKGLGLLQADPTEVGVYERWAALKEKLVSQSQKT